MSHAKNFQDLTGQKMHRLTFLSFVGRNEQRNARWKVRCDCGTIFEVTASSVKVGQTNPVDVSGLRITKIDTNINFFIS